MRIVSVYAVFADGDEADRIARAAIEEELAACVNILAPIRSIYRWRDAVESASEIAAIFKTSDQRSEALITRIAELHSYDVPCIAVWPIERALESYRAFVVESVSESGARLKSR